MEFILKKIKNINVTGLNEDENINLLQDIENLNLENIFLLNGNEISRIINSNTLVERFEILKKYPNTLDIKIKKTDFLAKMNISGKFYLIGSNGKLSDPKFSNKELPFTFGKPEINEFIKFKNIIDQSKLSINEIKNLYFFQSKRWDLELVNNVVLKLSKNNTKLSLDQAFEI